MRDLAAAYELIKEFEGFSAVPYLCPAGVWTIGYGHAITYKGRLLKGAASKPIAENIFPHITQADAEVILKADVASAVAGVGSLVKVPMNDNQFCALVSFVYNVGVGAFKRSTLLKVLNAGKYSEVPVQLRRWNKAAGKVLRGLTRRREAEVVLWR